MLRNRAIPAIGIGLLAIMLLIGLRSWRADREFSRAKQTMGSMRAVATMLECYADVHHTYPVVESALLIPPFLPVVSPTTHALDRKLLVASLSRHKHPSGWPLTPGMRNVSMRMGQVVA